MVPFAVAAPERCPNDHPTPTLAPRSDLSVNFTDAVAPDVVSNAGPITVQSSVSSLVSYIQSLPAVSAFATTTDDEDTFLMQQHSQISRRMSLMSSARPVPSWTKLPNLAQGPSPANALADDAFIEFHTQIARVLADLENRLNSKLHAQSLVSRKPNSPQPRPNSTSVMALWRTQLDKHDGTIEGLHNNLEEMEAELVATQTQVDKHAGSIEGLHSNLQAA
ncbi:hypothetical protein BDK51DRAFT_52937 [Blyttiomyces helicus]|uniref:Uncharacterized protein n=1 Tax=Blyttiomyces helicus TaxID=388810 RepID=A0A4P9WK45_9FUNG|nr:hypothetical protein BDK51DRAFT_52937 [Blyttiomyces helicus]|eukprot:RKO91520.1 hypothetical protein BDK51DRAFT_52937 [Blyttiomyces helicus]